MDEIDKQHVCVCVYILYTESHETHLTSSHDRLLNDYQANSPRADTKNECVNFAI